MVNISFNWGGYVKISAANLSILIEPTKLNSTFLLKSLYFCPFFFFFELFCCFSVRFFLLLSYIDCVK